MMTEINELKFWKNQKMSIQIFYTKKNFAYFLISLFICCNLPQLSFAISLIFLSCLLLNEKIFRLQVSYWKFTKALEKHIASSAS